MKRIKILIKKYFLYLWYSHIVAELMNEGRDEKSLMPFNEWYLNKINKNDNKMFENEKYINGQLDRLSTHKYKQ